MMTATEIRNAADIRRLHAHSLRLKGLTYKEIGRDLGVTAARAREIALYGEKLFNFLGKQISVKNQGGQ